MSCWAAPFRVPLVYPTLRKNERIATPGVSQIRFQLFLSRAHPRCVVLLGNSHALVAQQNRDSFDGNASKKQFNSERVAEAVRMPIRNVCEFEEFAQSRLPAPTMLSNFPLPLQKKNFSVTFGVASNADKTNPGRIVFT